MTELADVLVRDHGLSFGEAHEIVTASSVVRATSPAPSRRRSLAAAARGRGHRIEYAAADLARILSPEHFVAVRRTLGGPSPDVVAAALRDARAAARRGRRMASHGAASRAGGGGGVRGSGAEGVKPQARSGPTP